MSKSFIPEDLYCWPVCLLVPPHQKLFSSISRRLPWSAWFSFGNKSKSGGVISGLYDGWVSEWVLSKICRTVSATCGLALSCKTTPLKACRAFFNEASGAKKSYRNYLQYEPVRLSLRHYHYLLLGLHFFLTYDHHHYHLRLCGAAFCRASNLQVSTERTDYKISMFHLWYLSCLETPLIQFGNWSNSAILLRSAVCSSHRWWKRLFCNSISILYTEVDDIGFT